MIQPISPDTERSIRNAMKRLLAGGCGRLTVANLAREANISRATLYRAPHILAAFREVLAKREVKDGARNHVAFLEAQIAQMRTAENAELIELRDKVRVMAQHIQVLTLLAEERGRQIDALRNNAPPIRKVVSIARD